MHPRDIVIGAVLAGVVAALAFRAGTLTRGGAIAAFVVGTLTYATGTIGFTLVLIAFFLPAIILSRIGKTRKRELVDIGKQGARDALQVLANGGVATLCAVIWAYTMDPRWAIAFAGAYAAATADTWGTEIGTLARGTPRSILTLRPIAAGLSGGVTLLGTLAEVAGAMWLGAAAFVGILLAYLFSSHDFGFSWRNQAPAAYALPIALLVAVPLGGIAGALLDSVLGATLQELRVCERCRRRCETDPHACGAPTRRVRGIPGVSNDVVNLLATACGAAVAAAVLLTLR